MNNARTHGIGCQGSNLALQFVHLGGGGVVRGGVTNQVVRLVNDCQRRILINYGQLGKRGGGSSSRAGNCYPSGELVGVPHHMTGGTNPPVNGDEPLFDGAEHHLTTKVKLRLEQAGQCHIQALIRTGGWNPESSATAGVRGY